MRREGGLAGSKAESLGGGWGEGSIRSPETRWHGRQSGMEGYLAKKE